jgi:proteasome lid subunit RPN8/RPN11
MSGISRATIIIPPAILGQMVAYCRSCLPDEGCGILAGKGASVTQIYPMKNIEPSPVSYRMDPQEQFDVMRSMRESALEMVAIYHSHPDFPAAPSHKDIERAFYEDAAYVIVSFSAERPVVKAYRIGAGIATETAILHDSE